MRTIEDLDVFGVIQNKYLSVSSLKKMAIERYKECKERRDTLISEILRGVYAGRMQELREVFNLTDEDLK